jgi:hypothetical protein
MNIKKLYKNYGLSVVLFLLFISTWALHFVVQIIKVSHDQESRGEVFSWGQFFPEFLTSTFENWQSEFLQLLTFVVLTAYLIHKNSAESRDGTDRIEKKIDKILDIINHNKDSKKS